MAEQNCTKALFIASPERLAQLAPLLRTRLGEYIDLTSAMSNFLEVLQKGVNKAWAISQIAERLELDLDQCLAFGDGLNDLEMLQRVAHGVAITKCEPYSKTTCTGNCWSSCRGWCVSLPKYLL